MPTFWSALQTLVVLGYATCLAIFCTTYLATSVPPTVNLLTINLVATVRGSLRSSSCSEDRHLKAAWSEPVVQRMA